jgi:hypothetical protein
MALVAICFFIREKGLGPFSVGETVIFEVAPIEVGVSGASIETRCIFEKFVGALMGELVNCGMLT